MFSEAAAHQPLGGGELSETNQGPEATLTNYIRVSGVTAQVSYMHFKSSLSQLGSQHSSENASDIPMGVPFLLLFYVYLMYVLHAQLHTSIYVLCSWDNVILLPFAWLFGTFGLNCCHLAQKHSICHIQLCILIRIRRVIKETNGNFNGAMVRSPRCD